MSRLLYSTLTFAAGAIVLAIVRANPVVLVVVLAGWLLILGGLGLVMWAVSRGVDER